VKRRAKGFRVPGAAQLAAQRSGALQTRDLYGPWRSRISGAPLHFAPRGTAAGTRGLRRREFITFLGAAAAWPLAARAQQASKVPRVGLLFPGTETVAPARIAALREGLRAAGYREPDQVELIARVTRGDPSRVGPMASELVERNVDVLVPISPAAVQAVRSLTSTIPIVAYDLETGPIGSGLVKSLARPGGNITGVFFDFPEFSKKWLELMKEMLPRLARIGVLWDPATGFTQLRAIEAVAAIMNIELEIVEVRALTELDGAMAAASRNNVDALVMLSTPLVGGSSEPLANFTLQRRLPAVTLFPDFARSGGLMGYGPNIHNGYHQTARMVAKVLQGTKPADLPVELPSKFELVVNLKTAKTIGVELPTSVLLRADEVIE
jgi:putative ABC transport system substrate-binding protein